MYQKIIIIGEEELVPPDVIRRFWDKVDKKSKAACWEWTGSKAKGYGQLTIVGSNAPVKAHRLSWAIHFGAIPKGLSVCHACDNPGCVNPNHLLLGTHHANMIDAHRKGHLDNFVHGSGEDNNSAKFTNEQVKQIRQEYTSGATLQGLRDKYKISNIARIVRNIVYTDPAYNPINGNARPRPTRKVVPKEHIELILKSEKSAYKLSKELPYSKPTILKIRNGVY